MPDYELKRIKTLEYKRPEVDKGYADQTLYVNVSDPSLAIKPVAQKTKEVFIGGKGYDLWLLWNAVEPTTQWNDPQNTICIASGPMGGTPIYPGSGKSIVSTLSPLTGAPIDSNVGGYFGPYLKFSGFDAMEIQGKASADPADRTFRGRQTAQHFRGFCRTVG
jgi:aldehyde:ferredoxin oxidoreductase